MRWDGANRHEKLGHKKILFASQFMISNMAGMSLHPACDYTDTRSSQPNQACSTWDYSYSLVSSPLFSSLSPISLFLVHNSTIIAEHKVKSSLSISPCHNHELTPSTAYTKYSVYRVQHAPSTAYTKYSIHQVQHTQSTTYTEYSIYPRSFVFPAFLWSRVDPWMELQVLASVATWSTVIKPALHESSNLKLPCHSPTVAR